ncbi:MAG: PLP-dependent aminotransferase family protein [Niastella sp.]|uniref:MocR-like pyridoxine biosynthesis transcription factor PdxR n=1 Tax=Niastella sp. TaxID=1869183 RepID=UPI003899EC3D
MALLNELIIIDDKAGVSVYLQITNLFIHHIRQGRLRKGLKLPGSRELAGMLGINRMTVVAAYQELEAQGWIEMLPKKGTFIKATLPLLSPKALAGDVADFQLPAQPGFIYDKKRIIPVGSSNLPSAGKLAFNDGFPDVRLAPIEELTRCMRSLSRLSANKKYLLYGDAQGTLLLRRTLANFLCDTRGLSITAENILITNGAQMGIFIAASVIISPGDAVIVGVPGYNMANMTFQQLGAKLIYVPVDEEGIDTNAIEKLCEKKKIRMVYVIPHHHNPTTVTLSPERRMHLLSLATKYRFAVIEDDYDYDFHYSSKPIMPMASYDSQGNVIYIGTLTKTFAPAVRLGFIVAPKEFIQTGTNFRKIVDTQGDSLLENAIAELYKDGTIVRHIKKSVKLYKERRDHFCDCLQKELSDQVSFKVPDGGMSVWTTSLQHDLKVIARKAFDHGLIMKDGTSYDIGRQRFNAVRLGFASLNFKEQLQAVKIIKEVTAM